MNKFVLLCTTFVGVFLFGGDKIKQGVAEIITLEELSMQRAFTYLKCRDRHSKDKKFSPIDPEKDDEYTKDYIPEAFLVTIPNGRVYSTHGIVLVDNYLVKELLWDWSRWRKKPFDLKLLPTPKYTSSKVVVLSQEGVNNYYHWMVEVLPKIAFLEENSISYDYLFVPNQLSFMKQTLDLFGIDRAKILEVKETSYFAAKELIVPSKPARSCITPKWIIHYLRKRLLEPSLKQVHKRFSKRVFISRSKAAYRRIENEDKLFAMLEQYGFKKYYLEDMKVVEQVALFHGAEIIVAPHGAGLTNLLFVNPKAVVLEIFQQHSDFTFFDLCQQLDVKHIAIKTCEFQAGGGYINTTVDIPLIEDYVQQILKD